MDLTEFIQQNDLNLVDQSYIEFVVNFWKEKKFELGDQTPIQLWTSVINKMHCEGVSIGYDSELLVKLFQIYFKVDKVNLTFPENV